MDDEKKKCLYNDCYGREIAPCCLHCEEKNTCPERCGFNANGSCVWLVAGDYKKGIK